LKIASLAIALVSVAILDGCLVDLYGGDPRLQVRNRTGGGKVIDLRLGDSLRPGWVHEFDPPVDSGQFSEVLELPAAGELLLRARVTGPSLDTVIAFRRRVVVGEFCLVEISRDPDGRVRARE